jgi:hypothetical protein
LPLFVNGFAQVRPNTRRHSARIMAASIKLIRPRMPTMSELNGKVGFASPAANNKSTRRRHAGVELIATVALAVSLVIAATAVSIGATRAQVLGAVGNSRDASVALAALFGLALVGAAGMGGLHAIVARNRTPRPD